MSEANNGENDRPLSRLGVAEIRTEIATLRGEMWKEVTRLDGINDGRDKALEIQTPELERRLTALNHEASQLKDMQAMYVPRETYERDKKEGEDRLKRLEALAERMWLPILLIGGLAAGIGAAVVKVVFP